MTWHPPNRGTEEIGSIFAAIGDPPTQEPPADGSHAHVHLARGSTRGINMDQTMENYGRPWKTVDPRSILIQPNKIRMMEKLRMIIGPKARQSFQLLICLLYIYIHIYSLYMHMSCIQCMCIYI